MQISNEKCKHKMPKCYKIVILGCKKVGKTAIIEQLVHGHHKIGSSLHPTIEDIYEVLIENEQNVKEKVRIFDTAGLEESGTSELSKHVPIADGFILVYSIASKLTLDVVENVKKEIEKKGKECPLVVLGTKTDLLEQRECDYKSAMKWAETEKVKLYEICVGDRQALKEPLVWLVSRMGCQTGKGYLTTGKSDVKKFLSKKRAGSSKSLAKENSVSD
ncbi:NF-kappa-B inhibitor-interacting Ras-like protein 2 isoform X1 [Dendronephthya gigantea]|uniref:NF-kappa-B inhibitor-interacting Ras-like protein 2 isoform X1 n=1 Tax=Dendronephthya gigantea TaxID=151771 RepID=UPI00106CCFFC|nr:NF-kappa-B inhibitor-interacting Ras-like protein 2 isoform X1 [Dendronephthya gigantea]